MSEDVAPRVLVTGGASGIGAACVRRFARSGARIVIADLAVDAARDLASELGDGVRVQRLDVTDPDSVSAAIDAVVSELGGLDIAVNSAGVGMNALTPAAELDFAEWRRVLAIDLDGLFLTMRAEIAAMLGSGGGSIVNVASIMGTVAQRGASAYVAAKHGVIGLTKAAALDYAEHGIRINAIGPGHVATPLFARWPDDVRAEIESRYPTGRVATAEEVAEFVWFLAGASVPFATGGFHTIDGAYTAV